MLTVADGLLDAVIQQELARTGSRKGLGIEPRQIKVIDVLIDQSVDCSERSAIQLQQVDADSPSLAEDMDDLLVELLRPFTCKDTSTRTGAPSALMQGDQPIECGVDISRVRDTGVLYPSNPLEALHLSLQGISSAPSKTGSIGNDVSGQPDHRTAGRTDNLSHLTCLVEQFVPQIDRGRFGRHLREGKDIPLPSRFVEQVPVEALEYGALLLLIRDDIEV